MTDKPAETAEDRWEFNQQSEALYQARIENRATLSPSPETTDCQLNKQSGDFPFVSQNTGD